jgi:regulator of replication initiation timing
MLVTGVKKKKLALWRQLRVVLRNPIRKEVVPVPSRMSQLRAQRAELQADLNKMSAEAKAEQEALQSQINTLKQQADSLAAQFRQLFAAASSAYGSGGEDGKSTASGLAGQGHAVKAQCMALNGQVKGLIAELNAMRQQQKTAREQVKGRISAINDELRRTSKKQTVASERVSRPPSVSVPMSEPYNKPVFTGDETPAWMDSAFIDGILAELSSQAVDRIESITYINEVVWLKGEPLYGLTIRNNKVERTQILLYKSALDFSEKACKRVYRRVLIHEVGHVIRDKLLKPQHVIKWGRLFNTRFSNKGPFLTDRSKEELQEHFAECFMLYNTNTRKLYDEDREAYTLMKEIYEGLLP